MQKVSHPTLQPSIYTDLQLRCKKLKIWKWQPKYLFFFCKFVTLIIFACKGNKSIKLLMDYNQSHVVTFTKYFEFLWKKMLKKKIVKIDQKIWREREDNKAQQIDSLTIVERTFQRLKNKWHKANFTIVGL